MHAQRKLHLGLLGLVACGTGSGSDGTATTTTGGETTQTSTMTASAGPSTVDDGSTAGVDTASSSGGDVPSGAHGYFDMLVARDDFWKGYSLRPRPGEPVESVHYENQLLGDDFGGYAGSNDPVLGYWITYSPADDDDPQRQDAAKVRIPAFQPPGAANLATLAADIGPGEVVFELIGGNNPHNVEGRGIRVDDEIMTIVDPDAGGPLPAFDEATGLIHVERGSFGSAAAAHSADAPAALSINTVPNSARLPLGTSDGHTYVLTWDGLWTDSYMASGLGNHKTFNLISNAIWFEPNTAFSGAGHESCFDPEVHFAGIHARGYNALGGPADWTQSNGDQFGPAVEDNQPIGPRAQYCALPNVWLRFWVRIDQREDDYDLLDFWVASEGGEVVQLLSGIQASVRPSSNPPFAIETFYLEYNTSLDLFTRGDARDLVAYVRNLAVLIDPPSDLEAAGLFVAPEH